MLLAQEMGMPFLPFSAVTSGIAEVRAVIKKVESEFTDYKTQTITLLERAYTEELILVESFSELKVNELTNIYTKELIVKKEITELFLELLKSVSLEE
jgi:hypothetical protein